MAKRKIIKIDPLDAQDEEYLNEQNDLQSYYLAATEPQYELQQQLPPNQPEIEGESVEDSLRDWALRHRLGYPVINELLKILIDHGMNNLPPTASTLLRFTSPKIEEVNRLSKKMKTIEDTVGKVKTDLHDLGKKMDMVLNKLNNSPRMMNTSGGSSITSPLATTKLEYIKTIDESDDLETDNFSHYIEQFPITRLEDLDEFNTKLYNELFKNYMFRYVRRFSGKSPTKCCKTVTSHLLHDSLLEQFSWVGRDSKKQAFNVYDQIINLIFTAVAEHYPYTTYQEVTQNLRDILKHAPFRIKRKFNDQGGNITATF